MSFDLGDYVDVKTRITQFWETYPDGRIDADPPEVVTLGDRLFIASHVRVYMHHADAVPSATGSAWEQFPGRTPYTKDSEAMNAETSAVGRALGNMGIGLGAGLATADEVRLRRAEQAPISDEDRQQVHHAIAVLSDDAKAALRREWKVRRIRKLEELTVADLDRVNELIDELAGGDE